MAYDHITIHKITSSSVEFYAGESDGTGNASYTLETSAGATVTTGTSPADGEVVINNLSSGTEYVLYITNEAEETRTPFTTLTNDPKVATEDQWRDLAAKVKAKADSTNLSTVATSGSYNDLSNKPIIPSVKRQTDSATFSDISTLYVAGEGTTSAPMALRTHGDSSNGSYAYVNINEPTTSISSAYVGGYVWDNDEFWWQKLSEVRLALYSDLPTVNDSTITITNNGTTVDSFTTNASSNKTIALSSPVITMTTTDPGEGSALAENHYVAVYGGDPIIMDYSTSEINTGAKWIDGSAIYKKTINTGALPNATSKNVAHNISSLSRILKIEGYAYNTTAGTFQVLPMVAGAVADQVTIVVGNMNIVLTDSADRSAYDESYVTLYYTKSS